MGRLNRREGGKTGWEDGVVICNGPCQGPRLTSVKKWREEKRLREKRKGRDEALFPPKRIKEMLIEDLKKSYQGNLRCGAFER